MKVELEITNTDTPITALFCDECGRTVKSPTQTRLTAAECGQQIDYICWTCPNCGQLSFTNDDLSILDAEILGGI